MLVSYKWLKKYVNIPDSVSAEEVAAKLKASTVEVEKVEYQGKNLENVVVGKVIACEKHSNADKLKVCKVDVGGEQIQIVCGGSNVREGMLVALGKLGAKVKWHGEGELIELKQTAIRGVDSFGMICASTEIGLGEMFPLKEEKEILDLSVIASRAKQSHGFGSANKGIAASPLDPRNDKLVGRPLAEVLGLDDAVLEIDNKSLSNRPDLWGHYGIAREVAVLFGKKLKEYKTSAAFQRTVRGMISLNQIKSGKEIKLKVAVEDAKLCPRYSAVAMSGVEVKASPEWLQKSLLAVGLRPINNIVDITNYVMMDLGQPMHAFGFKISDLRFKNIVVRQANNGEEITTLDGQKRKLTSEMLVIADETKLLAAAGVMGGLDSGITNETKTIIFEAANFDASSIRKTSTKLGLRTDSSARFEKSLDPNLAEMALHRAIELVLEVCPKAKVASNVVDQKKYHLSQGPLEISMEFLEKKIGTKLQKKEVVRILTDLGFQVSGKGDEFKVKIPSWRATKDVSIPEDLVEEILRVHGYDKVAPSMPVFPITPPAESRLRKLERQSKNILVNVLSYTEVYNYSFVSPQSITKLGDSAEKYLELDNPLSQERPFLRRHLLNNLLENVKKNVDDYSELRLFEVGKKFLVEKPGARATANSNELLPRQNTWLVAVFASKKRRVSMDGTRHDFDKSNKNAFWEARRAAEAVFYELNKELKLTMPKKLLPWLHPSRSGEMVIADRYVGSVFELHPTVAENFGLECAVAVMALNLDELSDLPEAEKKYSSIAEFPAVERDLAISVKKSVAHADILAALLGANPLLQSVELFDVYEGKGVGEDYKSMAYHFVYQSSERTLVSEEVDKAHESLIKILKEKFGAEVR